MSVVSVTADSPEKQRVGMIGHCHGAADQAWSSAEVTAAVVFRLSAVIEWPGASGPQTIRRRRDSVSGQNAEPATTARTKPGPSAMALTNNAGDVFCHAELRVCGADAPGRCTIHRCENCSVV
jgi:hypothetical protein